MTLPTAFLMNSQVALRKFIRRLRLIMLKRIFARFQKRRRNDALDWAIRWSGRDLLGWPNYPFGSVRRYFMSRIPGGSGDIFFGCGEEDPCGAAALKLANITNKKTLGPMLP